MAAGGSAAKQRVTFLFRRTQGAGHCAGVNALALSADEQRLWTGSRDSIIACWDATAAPEPRLLHEHVGHIDWVNDLVLAGPDLLVSCSNDRTLRVWRPDAPDEGCLGCLTGHSDYVTGLAASASGAQLASGGLRGEVLLWDLERLRAIMAGTASDSNFAASAADVPHDSIYAMGMSGNGALVAAGTTQGCANLVDARSGAVVMSLKGHTDTIRALQLDGDGRLLLTGSSDHTIRLWDLGQQRCVQTLAVHTDSVWALAVGPAFASVYSGGRDGCIYRTRLASRVSELLASEQAPVLRLAVGADEGHLWAATTSPSVHKWAVEAREAPAAAALPVSPRAGGAAVAPIAGSHFIASPSAAARARLSFDLHGTRPTSQQLQPAAATPGLPPIRHAAVLTDRRHVLTQDGEGRVAMWDISQGAVVRDYGQAELKDVERRLFEPSQSVSAWFAPEVKLGSLGGSMEAPQCFGAEIYAQDLGDLEAPLDLKVNFGEQMLLGLFAQWAATQRGTAPQRPDAGGGHAGGAAPGQPAAPPEQQQQQQQQQQQRQQQADDDSGMPDADGSNSAPAALSSRFSFRGPLAPVVLCTASGAPGSVPWRCATDAFSGEEEVPQWVSDCVLRGEYPASRELKMAFQLLPLPGSGLPSLLQSKLNAPRVLRINKVADYVRRKMEDSGVALREEPLFWDPARAERWQAEADAAGPSAGAADAAGAPGALPAPGVHQLHPVGGGGGGGGAADGAGGQQGQSPAILITCKGHTVPWDFSLAAVRQWIWRRSDDLVLHYSARDENTPLRLPAIRPPS